MRIKSAKIQRDGKTIMIETTHRGNYRYVWFEADDLEALADMAEHL